MTTKIASKEKQYSISLSEPEDYTNTQIRFGDYIRLKGLKYGDVFYVAEPGYFDNVPGKPAKRIFLLVVGNCTPYCGVTSSDGGLGWIWSDYNDFILVEHRKLLPEMDGSFLHPTNVKMNR